MTMQLLASRSYPVIDYQTMAEFVGLERLFRVSDGTFLLHMASEEEPEPEERIAWLSTRDAISWLNEAPDQYGSFWEFAEIVADGNQQPPRSLSGYTQMQETV